MARGGLTTPEKAISKAEASISGKGQYWEQQTLQGFREKWNEWYQTFVFPQLVRIVPTLPPKTDNIRTNVMNRVVPVAEAISRVSAQYRLRRAREALIAPPPQT